jgi:2-hydroxychromene-2-carboxylate isomerase
MTAGGQGLAFVMATHTFAVTWDYRCPFAWKAHMHVVEALQGGADWDVSFVPFSLGQVHVAEGEPDIWDRPDEDTGLLALRIGVVVRDQYPDKFLAVHRELFAIRHVHAGQLNDEEALRSVLGAHGIDADAVLAEIAGGQPLATVRKEHEAAAADHAVWGVPTFIAGDQAVFVRLMNNPSDAESSRQIVERLIDTVVGWPDLNEFKHTSIPR